jgi:CRP/FNR family transcriptional regulator, cyclic AMP receptor protein
MAMGNPDDLVITLGQQVQAVLTARGGTLRIKSYADGATLATSQDGAEVAWFILSGALQISRDSIDGQYVQLAELGAHSLVGELAMLDSGTRSATVRAVGETECVIIPRADFHRLLLDQAAFSSLLALQLAARLRDTTDGVFALAALPIPARLARALLDLPRVIQADGTLVVEIASVTKFASRVHATRESVSITLSKWAKEGLVSRTARHQLIILKPAALSKIADY